jgi:hypothetical protein
MQGTQADATSKKSATRDTVTHHRLNRRHEKLNTWPNCTSDYAARLKATFGWLTSGASDVAVDAYAVQAGVVGMTPVRPDLKLHDTVRDVSQSLQQRRRNDSLVLTSQ